MNIAALDKASVLMALYNNAKPLGMGYLHFTPEPMKREEAELLLKEQSRFDYLHGRVMKIKIEDDLYTTLYNRDNGPNAAEEALKGIEKGTSV